MMEQELIELKETSVLTAFSSGDGMDPIISQARAIVDGFEHNLSTDKGRKATASLAHKVRKFKVRLDGMGKDLVSDWKSKSRAVDANRKQMRDAMDVLSNEARAPLDAWEKAEQDRVNGHQDNINEMQGGGDYSIENWMTHPLQSMKDRLDEIQDIKIDDSWEEFANRASVVRDVAIDNIMEAILKREAYDAEQAELNKLREEKAERERLDHEESIRQEAKAQAEKEAEQALEKEKQEKLEAQRQAEKAEADRASAEARAKQAEEDAIQAVADEKQAEIKRQEHIKQREEQEKKTAEANTQHVGHVRKDAKEALMKWVDEPTAKKIVLAINAGKVPHITISY